jgi:hypothetical protein
LSFLPTINKQHHFRSAYFKYLLKSQLNQKLRTFIFAASGSVASDQCMILATLRKMHCLPKIVIYGVTPRDFINNGIFCPASTPVFQYLDQRFEVGNLYQDVYENKNNPLYTVLKNCLYFFRENIRLKNTFVVWWQKLLLPFDTARVVTSDWRDSIKTVLPSDEQFQDEPAPQILGKRMLDQYVKDKKPYLVSDLNSNSLAYRPFSEFIYKQQLSYFSRLISLCKSEDIQLIIVNMPTTQEHIELFAIE